MGQNYISCNFYIKFDIYQNFHYIGKSKSIFFMSRLHSSISQYAAYSWKFENIKAYSSYLI